METRKLPLLSSGAHAAMWWDRVSRLGDPLSFVTISARQEELAQLSRVWFYMPATPALGVLRKEHPEHQSRVGYVRGETLQHHSLKMMKEKKSLPSHKQIIESD